MYIEHGLELDWGIGLKVIAARFGFAGTGFGEGRYRGTGQGSTGR
jgi:hypothetical protein